MAFSQGSRSRLSRIKEITFGTTPGGSLTRLAYTSHDLDLTKELVSGNDIQPDRMPRVSRHGHRAVGGSLNFDLRADDYDDILASVLGGTWDTSPSSSPDELKPGTNVDTYTFEDYAADINQTLVYTGCGISSLEVSIKPNQMISCTAGIVGRTRTVGALGNSITTESDNQPFDSYSGALEIADSGSSLSSIATITGVDFSINNGLSQAMVLGTDIAPCLFTDRMVITGSITAYFEDASLINRFENETETAFKVAVNDPTGGNEYSFFFPKAKFNGASIPVSDGSARIVTIPFEAIHDSTEDAHLVIYRPETA